MYTIAKRQIIVDALVPQYKFFENANFSDVSVQQAVHEVTCQTLDITRTK